MNQNPILIPEITRILCSFVDYKDLLNLALTCRLFYQESCFRLWNTLNPKSHRTLRKIKNTLDNTKTYNKYVKKFCLSAREDTWHFERFFFDSFLFPNLKELEFSNAAAQDHIVYPMISAAKESLYALNLSQCYCLSTTSIKPLLSMPSHQLKSLVLYGCGKIDPYVLTDIIYRHSQTLTRIRLTDINDTILEAIQSCTQLTDLGLEHCNDTTLSTAALDSFFNTVKKNQVQLTHLRLRDIENLTSDHLKTVAQVSTFLVHFDISECNRVSPEGVFYLAEECVHLHTLLLAYQLGVTNRAVRSFISNCHQLKHMDVSGCRLLTDHAFIPLLKRKNDNLMQLQLETLNISGLEFLTSTIILQILEHVDSLNELCLGVTYNQDEADNILEVINSGQVKFYIDIEKCYTICRITNNKQAKKYGHKRKRVLDHVNTLNRNFSLPSSSTWNLPI